MSVSWRAVAIAVLVAGLVSLFFGSSMQAQQQQAAPQPAPQQQQAAQQPVTWDRLPRMQLEQMFAGPLQDTVIQRYRDPQTGTICYVYLPFTVEHSARTPTGAVQYGANTIGSLSCLGAGGSAGENRGGASAGASGRQETGAETGAGEETASGACSTARPGG